MPLHLAQNLTYYSLVALISFTACRTPAHRFTQQDRQAVVNVLQAQAVAWNRGDLRAYMEGYLHGSELVFTSGNKIRRGWQETYEKYKARYTSSNSKDMGHLSFEFIEVQSVGADGAVVLGRWKLTNTPVAGSGIFSVVLERRPEGWKVIHDHTSAEPSSN